MKAATLLDLAGFFGVLSLLSFGGGNTVIPDIFRHAVLENHWLTSDQFVAAYAIAQSAPGPSSLLVALVGWQAAGWPGAILATAAMYGPSSLLTYGAAYYWQRFRDRPAFAVLENGLAPVTIGLILASGWIVAVEVDKAPAAFILTAATALLVARTGVNPLLIMALAGLLGAMGWL